MLKLLFILLLHGENPLKKYRKSGISAYVTCTSKDPEDMINIFFVPTLI